MYSQCPECQTRFRVTAAALRAARGTVRCGRCGSAFDALERLSDSVPPPAPEAPAVPLLIASAAVGAPESTADAEYHFTAEDLERVFVEAGDWHDRPAPPAAAAEGAHEPAGEDAERAGVGAEAPIVVVDENAAIEDITMEGERIRIEALPAEDAELWAEAERAYEAGAAAPEFATEVGAVEPATEAAAPSPEPEAEVAEAEAEAAVPASESTETAAAALVPAAEALPRAEVAAAAAAAVAVPPAEPEAAPIPMPPAPEPWHRPADRAEALPARPAPAWGNLAWTLGGLVLALVLAAQVIHHYRQDLVRHPQLGPPLRAAYDRLGLALLPNWDLGAFELRQWGNEADAAAQGRMVVRASLTNRAAFAQPHPVLRLELEDRYGNPVATRDFEPADYLKNPSQASRLIAPGASSEAELLLADPGPESVGYRLDVCLRESAALLRCAGGQG